MRNGRNKKFMLENYAHIERERDLYQRYFWDQQNGCTAQKTEKEKQGFILIQVSLWQCLKSHGGYVIIKEGGSPRIEYLDDAIASLRDNYSEHTMALRNCLERLRIYRSELCRINS
jgi:hypothetical protein